MKKFLMIMLLSFVGLFASAESIWFKAYNYAIKYKTEYNRNNSTGWSDVEKCDVPIEFKMNDDMIIIYSNKTQIYGIYEDAGAYNDNGGGKQQAYYVIDQDYDKGMIRLRITSDGTAQLYVDFNDVSWVYNMVRQ